MAGLAGDLLNAVRRHIAPLSLLGASQAYSHGVESIMTLTKHQRCRNPLWSLLFRVQPWNPKE